jgi:hypothetical protein
MKLPGHAGVAVHRRYAVGSIIDPIVAIAFPSRLLFTKTNVLSFGHPW